MMQFKKTLAVLAVGGLIASPLVASEITYRPINPSFGGDPFNGSFLLQSAEIQNQHEDDSLASLFEEPSTADQFADAIRGSIIGASASQLIRAVFQDGAPPTGTFTLDDATVDYITLPNGRVRITVTDGITTNVLEVPPPVNMVP